MRVTVAATTLITLAGYAVLLIQQMVYARLLGVTAATDALAGALIWVNSTAWLVGTVFISIMVPLYARHLRSDPRRAGQLFGLGTSAAVAIGVALALGTFVCANDLAGALAPGADGPTLAQMSGLLAILAPAITLSILVAVLSSLANAHERFRPVAAVSAIQPVVVILALTAPSEPTVELAAAGYSLGAAAQTVTLAIVGRRWLRDLWPRASVGAGRSVAQRAVPVFLAFGFIYAAQVAARVLASLGMTGDATIVDYANRLVGAAEQATLAAFLTIALTTWSIHVEGDTEDGLPMAHTFRVALGVFAGAAALGFVVAPAGIALLFEGGSFGGDDAAALADFLRWMAPGVAAHALLMLGIRALLARDANWALTLTGLVNLVVFVGIGFAASPMIGVNSLGAAYTVSWLASCVVCFSLLSAHLGVRFGMSHEIGPVAATLALAVPSGLVVQQLATSPAGQLALGFVAYGVVVLTAGRRFRVAAISLAPLPTRHAR